MKIDLYRLGEQKAFISFEAAIVGTPADVVLFDSKAYRFQGSVSSKKDDKWIPAWCYVQADFLVLDNNPLFQPVLA